MAHNHLITTRAPTGDITAPSSAEFPRTADTLAFRRLRYVHAFPLVSSALPASSAPSLSGSAEFSARGPHWHVCPGPSSFIQLAGAAPTPPSSSPPSRDSVPCSPSPISLLAALNVASASRTAVLPLSRARVAHVVVALLAAPSSCAPPERSPASAIAPQPLAPPLARQQPVPSRAPLPPRRLRSIRSLFFYRRRMKSTFPCSRDRP